jgi:hypothetical protein
MTTDFAEVAQLLNERIEYLAHEIFGFPSHRSATELRFGESGAVSVVIAGDKLGNWYDFRSCKGGDGLELICEFRGLGRIDALEFGRQWLGLDSANGSKPNGKHNGKGNGADDEAGKLAKAETIARATGPIKDTSAARYLALRGITSADVMRLPNIGWNPCAWTTGNGINYGAIVFKATDDAGRVRAVQQIYLTEDGKKAPIEPHPVKRTNGLLSGVAVRFTGDADTGTVILCEGPETALSVWQSTRRDVLALLGPNFANAPVRAGSKVIIARDADVIGSQADKTVNNAAEHLARRGFTVRIATPPRYDDLKKSDFNDVLQREGEKAVARLIADAVAYMRPGATAADYHNTATGWGDPDLGVLQLQRRTPPALPLEVFGRAWGDWIVEAAEAAACPPDYVAAPLLAAVSALIGNARWAQASPGWSEPPFLWICTVGDSGNGKSPGSDCLMRDVLPEIERKMIADFPDRLQLWRANQEYDKAREETWKSEVREAQKSKTAPPLPPAPTASREPESPRLRQHDTTIEKVATLLCHAAPKGLLITRDELAGWVEGMTNYNDAGRQFWLEAYGGRPFRVERQKLAEPIIVPRLGVAVSGGVQPDKVAMLMRGPDDGLLARFLWLWPEPVPFDVSRRRPGAVWAIEALDRLRELDLQSGDSEKPAQPIMVALAEAGISLMQGFGRAMQARQTFAGGRMRSALGKARGQVLRLSLGLEFLWWCAEKDSMAAPPTRISVNAFAEAERLVRDYFIPMAERTYGDAAATDTERNASTMARWIARDRPDEVHVRKLQREVRLPGLRLAGEIHSAAELLVEADWLTPPPPVIGFGRGRAVAAYAVNPALWQRLDEAGL